jgi:hypothetical protein
MYTLHGVKRLLPNTECTQLVVPIKVTFAQKKWEKAMFNRIGEWVKTYV